MLFSDVLSPRFNVFLVLVNFIAKFVLQLLREDSLVVISRVVRERVFQYLAYVSLLPAVMSLSFSSRVFLIRENVTNFGCPVVFLLLLRYHNSLVIFFIWTHVCFWHPFRKQMRCLVFLLAHFDARFLLRV